jgi:hypothetical protein
MIWEINQELPEFNNSYNNQLITEGFAKEYYGGKR